MFQGRIHFITSKLEQMELSADRQSQERDALKYQLEQLQKTFNALMKEKEEILKQNKILVVEAEKVIYLFTNNGVIDNFTTAYIFPHRSK